MSMIRKYNNHTHTSRSQTNPRLCEEESYSIYSNKTSGRQQHQWFLFVCLCLFTSQSTFCRHVGMGIPGLTWCTCLSCPHGILSPESILFLGTLYPRFKSPTLVYLVPRDHLPRVKLSPYNMLFVICQSGQIKIK